MEDQLVELYGLTRSGPQAVRVGACEALSGLTGDASGRALLALDAQSAWARSAAPADESAVTLDVPARTYRFARYPPLGFFFDVRLFVVLGAFFIAGCAQLYFFLFVKRLTCPFAAHYPKHHFRPLP